MTVITVILISGWVLRRSLAIGVVGPFVAELRVAALSCGCKLGCNKRLKSNSRKNLRETLKNFKLSKRRRSNSSNAGGCARF
jgi:hypothetical protein